MNMPLDDRALNRFLPIPRDCSIFIMVGLALSIFLIFSGLKLHEHNKAQEQTQKLVPRYLQGEIVEHKLTLKRGIVLQYLNNRYLIRFTDNVNHLYTDWYQEDELLKPLPGTPVR